MSKYTNLRYQILSLLLYYQIVLLYTGIPKVNENWKSIWGLLTNILEIMKGHSLKPCMGTIL